MNSFNVFMKMHMFEGVDCFWVVNLEFCSLLLVFVCKFCFLMLLLLNKWIEPKLVLDWVCCV